MVNLSDSDNTLILLNTELGDTLAGGDMGVARGVCRHLINVAVAAVCFVDDTDAVGLDDAELLESRASGGENNLVARLTHLNRDTKVNQLELARLHIHVFGGTAIHPLARMCLLNLTGGVAVIANENVNSIHRGSSLKVDFHEHRRVVRTTVGTRLIDVLDIGYVFNQSLVDKEVVKAHTLIITAGVIHI